MNYVKKIELVTVIMLILIIIVLIALAIKYKILVNVSDDQKYIDPQNQFKSPLNYLMTHHRRLCFCSSR